MKGSYKIFNYLRLKFSRKNCFTMRSTKSDIFITLCGDTGCARLTTPQMTDIADIYGIVDIHDEEYQSRMTPMFTKAYKMAIEAGDDAVADEVHKLRKIICNQ